MECHPKQEACMECPPTAFYVTLICVFYFNSSLCLCCRVGLLISYTTCAQVVFYSALFAFKESYSCRILLEYVLRELVI
jgi:hypothetical protein